MESTSSDNVVIPSCRLRKKYGPYKFLQSDSLDVSTANSSTSSTPLPLIFSAIKFLQTQQKQFLQENLMWLPGNETITDGPQASPRSFYCRVAVSV